MYRYVKSKVSKATKSTARGAAKVVNVEQISEVAGQTYDLAKTLATPAKSERRETFAHAVMRRGLTEQDLTVIHRQNVIQSCMFLLFMTVALAIGAYSALALGSYLTSGAAFGAFMVFLGYYIRFSFRASQIEARELFGLPYWARNPSLWMPAWTLPPSPRGSTSNFIVCRHD